MTTQATDAPTSEAPLNDPILSGLQGLAYEVGRIHARLDQLDEAQTSLRAEVREGFARLQADVDSRVQLAALGRPFAAAQRTVLWAGGLGGAVWALISAGQKLHDLGVF